LTFQELKEISLAWAHNDLGHFTSKVERAKKIIETGLKFDGKKYAAFSGGKDSTAMLHLVLSLDPDCMVFHYDYKDEDRSDGSVYMPEEYQAEIIENMKKIGAKNIKIESGHDWYKVFFGKIAPALYRDGYRVSFVGLRKEESSNRRQRIKANRSLTNIKEFWPLQDWSWRDVWAYIFFHDLPVHSAYKKYGELIGWDKVRFVTFFDAEMDKFGSSNLDGMLLWRFRNKRR